MRRGKKTQLSQHSRRRRRIKQQPTPEIANKNTDVYYYYYYYYCSAMDSVFLLPLAAFPMSIHSDRARSDFMNLSILTFLELLEL